MGKIKRLMDEVYGYAELIKGMKEPSEEIKERVREAMDKLELELEREDYDGGKQDD